MFIRISVPFLGLLACLISEADTDVETRAAKHFAAALYEKVSKLALEDLEGSGLAQSDIDSIVDEAVFRSAKCIIDSVALLPDDTHSKVVEMLADGEDLGHALEPIEDAVKSHPNPKELDERRRIFVDDCMATVNQDLGISIN